MALWIKALSPSETVRPKNGAEFTLQELQSYVGGYIEAVRLDDDTVMWVNEEGKLKGLPPNAQATVMAQGRIRPDDHIVGDVLIATLLESGGDDE